MLAFRRRYRCLRFCVPAAYLLLSSAAHSQSAVTYSYDARGRVVAVNDGVGTKSAYSLDPADNRTNLTTQLQFATSWEAQALPHVIGYADGNGWAANVTISSNYLTYGPYTTSIPVGSRVAVWRMMIDIPDVTDNSPVATLDVRDATTGDELATTTITRHQWVGHYAYQVFELPFTLDSTRSGHSIEIRTYYIGAAYLRVEKLGYY